MKRNGLSGTWKICLSVFMKPHLLVVLMACSSASALPAQGQEYRGRNFDYYQSRDGGYDDYDSGSRGSGGNWYDERKRREREHDDLMEEFKEQHREREEQSEQLRRSLYDDRRDHQYGSNLGDAFDKPRERGPYYEESTPREDRSRTIAPRGGQEFGDDRFDYRRQKSMSEIMRDQLRTRN